MGFLRGQQDSMCRREFQCTLISLFVLDSTEMWREIYSFTSVWGIPRPSRKASIWREIRASAKFTDSRRWWKLRRGTDLRMLWMICSQPDLLPPAVQVGIRLRRPQWNMSATTLSSVLCVEAMGWIMAPFCVRHPVIPASSVGGLSKWERVTEWIWEPSHFLRGIELEPIREQKKKKTFEFYSSDRKFGNQYWPASKRKLRFADPSSLWKRWSLSRSVSWSPLLRITRHHLLS
jgi:hypothetical protein